MKTSILSICSTMIVASMLLFLLLFYEQIPMQVPWHYDLTGKVDGWGGRQVVWHIAMVNVALNLLLAFLTRRPDVHNYPFPITETNRERAYAASSLFVAVLRLMFTSIITFIVVLQSLSVERIPMVFCMAILFAPLVGLIWGVRRVYKSR